jgi:2-polyprenyl-3-methyl-5-hydroxy-6-metoxy-1,4-benzoquinol methylase
VRADEVLQFVRGPEVLDIGCAGHQVNPSQRDWLHGRLREHFKVTGIDISESNVALLRQLGFDRLHVQSADAFDLGAKYNTIVAGEVLEHVSNPGQFFARVRKHLLPNGRLVLSTPYVFSLMYAFYAFDHFPKTCENGEHTCWFCPKTIAELSRREGLEIESWRLIDDYNERVVSFKYRAYWKVVRSLGRLLPDKLTKTNMIVVLRHATDAKCSADRS